MQKIEMTGASNECTIFLPRGVQFLVEQLSESELIVTAKKLAIGSFSYWVGCCVVFDHENEIYSFGEVAYIFQCKGDYFLCCKRMAVVEYVRHYHSYVVQESGEYVMLQYASLYDPQPLGMYIVNGQKHVMLKYHIH